MSIHAPVLPTPGITTTFENIPQELRDIQQWILWKPVVRGRKLVKIPVSWMHPLGDNINAHDPGYWGTFDQVVSVMHADPRFGIGLVLDNTGIICLDHDDHPGDDREAVALGSEYMSHLQAAHPTYCERSLQGGGLHSFYRGVLPHGRTGGIIDQLNLEIYAAQFIAITGNGIIGSRSSVAEGQPIIDSWKLPPPVATTALGPTEALGRSLRLSDADVISTMIVRRKQIYLMMANSSDLQDRSTAYAQIIGDLDKITGLPEQIDRIIRKCPFFKNAYNSSKYDQSPRWLGKSNCTSMLDYWLKQARSNNTESIPYAEHLTGERRAFVQSIFDMYTAERIAREAPLPPEAIAARATSDESIAALSCQQGTIDWIIGHLLCGADQNSKASDALEHLIDCNVAGMKKPFRLFAEVATVATFGALFSRKFKSCDGLASTALEILVAPTASGKGEAFRFWISRVNERATPMTTAKVFTSPISSAEAFHGQLQKTGTMLWAREDANSDIQILAAPKDPTQNRLRDYLYELFDASTFGHDAKQPPASIASRERKDAPIPNACGSLLWSTTPAAFLTSYNLKVLSTGLGSRALVTFHDAPSGKSVDDRDVVRKLSPRGNNILNLAVLLADEIDEAYISRPTEAAEKVKLIAYEPSASDFIRKIELAQDDIHTGVDSGEMPNHYAVFLRTAMLTKKMALVSAITRALDLPRCGAPVVLRCDIEWAVSRVLRSLAGLAKLFDQGTLGEGGDAERRAAIKEWVKVFFDAKKPPRDKRVTTEMLRDKIIPYWWMLQRADKNNAFKQTVFGADRALRSALDSLVDSGAFARLGNREEAKRYQVIDAEIL